MTHTRNIRDDVQQAGDPSVAALCVRHQGLSACYKLWWTSRSWRSRTHAERRLNKESDTTWVWLRLSCAASGKKRLVSVHLCDSGHLASPTSPRLKRSMTFDLGQRSTTVHSRSLHTIAVRQLCMLLYNGMYTKILYFLAYCTVAAECTTDVLTIR